MTIVVRVETDSQAAKESIEILGMQRSIPVTHAEDGAVCLSFPDRFDVQARGVEHYLSDMPKRFARQGETISVKVTSSCVP